MASFWVFPFFGACGAGFMDLGSDTKELFQLAKIRSGGGSMGGIEMGWEPIFSRNMGTIFFSVGWCWIFSWYTHIYINIYIVCIQKFMSVYISICIIRSYLHFGSWRIPLRFFFSGTFSPIGDEVSPRWCFMSSLQALRLGPTQVAPKISSASR